MRAEGARWPTRGWRAAVVVGVLGALATTSGCAGAAKRSGQRQGPTPSQRAEAASAVAAVLDDWHDAASKADGARYFGHFTAAAVFVGTDATERWDVPAFRAYAAPHFKRGRGWTYRATSRHVTVSASGDTAWFDEALASEKYGAVRGSGVLRRVAGRWRIAHYVMSFPIPNAKAKAVLSLVRGAGASGAGVEPGGR